MGRYRGPKDKLSRREGVDLFGTQPNRLDTPPGEHGARHRYKRQSDFDIRLREKQKVKRMYGVREKQFRRYVEQATKADEPTGRALLKLLERRLDNVVYRLNWARTRPMARQLVNHGHVKVNGRKVDIPSYRVKPGEVIELKSKATKMPDVQELLEAPMFAIPSWLERTDGTGRILDMPNREEIDAHIDEHYVVEFYSR